MCDYLNKKINNTQNYVCAYVYYDSRHCSYKTSCRCCPSNFGISLNNDNIFQKITKVFPITNEKEYAKACRVRIRIHNNLKCRLRKQYYKANDAEKEEIINNLIKLCFRKEFDIKI